MKNKGYTLDQTEGLVPVRKIIEPKYKNEAEQVAAYLNAITLSGDVTKANRSPDDIKKDQEAIDFLNELSQCNNPAFAYGFMIYNETGIMKQYWSKRCGKLRKNKTEFFQQDVYLEWIINVFKILNGDHEYIHNSLYYYKPGGKDKQGRPCGDYDVMNSFRTHWNMYCLPILAKWLFSQDRKETDYNAVSIEASYNNADAGHHLEAEMADSVGSSDPMQDAIYDEVETCLRGFTTSPWTDPISANTKSGAVTYLDVVKSIVAVSCDSLAGLRKQLNLSQSVQNKAIERIQSYFSKCGISVQDLGDYLSRYATTAMDILNGDTTASFRELYN